MDLTEEFQPSSTRNTFENTCQLPAQKLPRFNLNSRFHFGIEQDITRTNFVLHQHYVSNIITAVTLLVLGGIKCNLSIIKIATLSDPRFSLTMSDSNMNAVTQQGGGDVEAVDEEKYFEAKLVLKQQPRSPYWPFFKFVGTKLKGTDGKTLHCMLCLESQDERMKKKTIAYGGGTACIKYHMERYHKEKLEASIEEEGSMKGQTSLLNFYVTSSVVIPTLKSIEHHLKPNMNDPRYIADIKRIMLSDLLERMKKNINFPFMIKASALDPRFKKLKFIPSAQREAVFNSLKLEADLAFYGKDVGSSQDSSKNEEDDNKPAKKQRVEVNYDISDSDEEEEDTSQSNVTKEIERYKKEEQNPEADPLAWWREREKSYPILSRLAKRILCVPATSVEAERRFSDLGLLLTKRRLCLTGPHVDMMLFLKDKHMKVKK